MPSRARHRTVVPLLTALAAALAPAAVAPAAHAAPVETVTTLAASGAGSLTNAVNAVDDGGTIVFVGGLTGTITLGSALHVVHGVTIEGPGAQRLAISAGGRAPIFAIDSAGDVTLSGLTLRDGAATFAGSSANGGAVSKRGTGALIVRDASVVDNTALNSVSGEAVGGGIYVEQGALTLERTTVARNSAIAANGASQARGGGIALGLDAGGATLRDVTIAGNAATSSTSMGGGVANLSIGVQPVVMERVTIAGNSAAGAGGLLAGPTTRLVNSVIADNVAGASPDCAPFGTPAIAAGGVNLIGDASGCATSGATTISGDARLAPLALNEPGATETMALGAGSPALDAAPTSGDFACAAPATDQRGVTRPRGGACDLGAFEARPAALAAPLSSGAVFGVQDPSDGPTASTAFRLRNTADADFPLRIDAIALSGPDADQFVLDGSGCPAALSPGAACEIAVAFDPSSTGTKVANLDIATSVGDFHPSLRGLTPPAVVTVANLSDSGAGSLRRALDDVARGGTVAFADGLEGTIRLAAGELAIAKGVTIEGPGADKLTISGEDSSRIFSVSGDGDVTLSGLTLTRGRVDSAGDALGGAILKHGAGRLTVRDAAITDSRVESAIDWSYGGGVMVYEGSLLMERVTLAGNSSVGAPSAGGALMLFPDVTAATLRNVTIAGNTSRQAAGGVAAWAKSGPTVLEHVTIAGNSAGPGSGGGVSTFDGSSLTLVDSIVADNAGDGAPDCAVEGPGSVELRGVNLIESTTGCVLTGAGAGAVISGVDPRVAPLALGGVGQTETMALAADSPAIDAAPLAGDGACPPPGTDQRGVARPQGGACDLGAFEARPAVARLTPAEHDFGARTVGSGAGAPAALTLANDAEADLPLTPAALTLGGADADQFALAAGDCPALLAPGADCDLQARFAPTRVGAAEATVGDAGGASATLRGEGIAPDPEPPAPPAPTPPTPPAPVPPSPRPPVVKPAAVERFALARRCVRPGRRGRVAVGLELRLTVAARVRVQFARAIGTRGLARCPRRGSPGRFDGSFAPAGTFLPGEAATVRAAAVGRRYTIAARLRPALYRVTVRPYTGARTLGRPVSRYLRVLAP